MPCLPRACHSTKPRNSRTIGGAPGSWSRASPPQRVGTAAPLANSGNAPLDEATLARVRVLIGHARLDQLLDLFAAELDARHRSIRDALADRAFDRAAAEAHSLQAAAASLGATEVVASATELHGAIAAAAACNTRALAPALQALAASVGNARHALAGLSCDMVPHALHS